MSITTSTSALLASQIRVANAANNIANATSKDYVPRDVTQRADADGNVRAQVLERRQATDVSIEDELIKIELAANDFSANAVLIKAQKKTQGSLVDIFA